jgi:dipeptidyl aminopeptidase/acylaminoacyl peptidase
MTRIAILSFLVFSCRGTQAPTPATPERTKVVEVAPPASPGGARTARPVSSEGHPNSSLIPRSVLFGNPERTNVQVSPDGKYLSWLAAKDGVLNIWVAPIDHLDAAKAITNDATRPIFSYQWTFDDRHLVYGQDKGGDGNYHLYRVDVTGGASVDLTAFDHVRVWLAGVSRRKPGTLAIIMNDRDPRRWDLYEVDLATGKRRLRYQDDEGIAAPTSPSGYTLDDDFNVVLATKPVPDGSFQILRRESKGWQTWGTIPFEDAETTAILGASPDGKRVFLRDTRGRDTAALVDIDIATKKLTVIAEDSGADMSSSFAWTLRDPRTRTVRAASVGRLRTTWRALDKSVQPDLDGLARLAGAGEFSVPSMTADDKLWIVATSSAQHPEQFYLWDRTKRVGTYLFSTNPALDTQPLVDTTSVEVSSRDGLQLVAYLTLPRGKSFVDGRATSTSPMVLLVHGGPWARSYYGFDSWSQLLANRGYAVLDVNFRGSSGFGKRFLNAGNLQWSKKMHEDLLDAVAWAVDRNVTTTKDVAIAGRSYGGYAALVGLAMTPDVFRCGIDMDGPSNLLTLIAASALSEEQRRRVGDPDTADGRALLVAASPLTHAADIKHAVLIGQGANDPIVNESESEQIVDAMKAHQLPVTYLLFPDEGHHFARPENDIAFWGAAEAFLSANLGGEYVPLTADELKATSMKIREGKDGIPGLP